MKLATFPVVERGWGESHIKSMPKFYRYKGVSDIDATVWSFGPSVAAKLDSATVRRALLSGAQTVTIFGTMRDLMPKVEGGGVRDSWEKVGEYLRHASGAEASETIKTSRADVKGPPARRRESEAA